MSETPSEPRNGAEPSLNASYSGFDSATDAKVRTIARELSYRKVDASGQYVPDDDVAGVNPFDGQALQGEPRLDPKSPSFDAKYWVRNMRAVRDSDPGHYHHTSMGVAFKDLRAYGRAADADYQATTANAPFKLLGELWDSVANSNDTSRNFDILKPMDGILKKGSVTVVLGRPGAGCTTLLKTLSTHTYGYHVAKESVISYDGLSPQKIRDNYRGDVTFSAEMDVHFPHLSVGQTLNFAATLRTPQNRPDGISREEYASRMTDVYMAMYGLSHTFNTPVGNEYVRGVSGGERKRVSIAEVSIAGSYLQCWDNATRGLDSATALEFIRALKTQAEVLDVTSIVAIYQCSQDAYDLFDNCILLYEGYQIYSGPGALAKEYFERMGYECPPRQTTADFLTSLTNPAERIIRKGFSKKVPRTPKQFYDYWRASSEHSALVAEVDEYLVHHQSNSVLPAVSAAHRARQADHTFKKSPYTVSYFMQVKALTKRNFQRTMGSPMILIITLLSNIFLPLVNSVLFWNQANDTSSFYSRGSALLVAVVLNCISSLLEILTMFEARPVLEKHKQFALYRPSAAAIASVLSEFPSKVVMCIIFNVIFYFMINFRREPGPFFFFMLINLFGMLYLSHIFRTIGSIFHTLSASATPSAMTLVILVLYSGFPIPTPNMLGWSRWINYLNPMAYSFEALLANEFHGRNFPCVNIVPSGPSYVTSPSLTTPVAAGIPTTIDTTSVCSVVGAVAGQSYVTGDAYIQGTYDFSWAHAWRNFGIIIGFTIFFLLTYLLATELNNGAMQRGEVTLFPRSKLRKIKRAKRKAQLIATDLESGGSAAADSALAASQSIMKEDLAKIHAGTDIFHWRDVCYDVQIGPETRRLLNNVDGWVQPGTLTALMGASGAGKTTLLDVLASRVTMGTIYGHMFVNGRHRDASFQRSTGYAQQQDVHLGTSTVREALQFSAYLRQPASVSTKEKNDYVESVISILEMDAYADAVVGVAGEGLNVEQRKRLTIGVELAAKPKLLLFLDEPTSGLDSQTAWSVVQLMRKLADHGQAILCTIHQPSALLFQEFDRLLFLARGGRTVYFGDIGNKSNKLIKYFESHGAPECPPDANPAEWMLSVIGAAPGTTANQDYHEVWKKSKEFKKVQRELVRMERELPTQTAHTVNDEELTEYAAGMWTQYWLVTKRMLEYDWRNPVYLWSKFILTIVSCLFLGFTMFNANMSQRGLSNQMFCAMMFTTVLTSMMQQTIPHFLYHRVLYEVRERPSKMFGWFPWIMSQLTSEMPWQIITGTLAFLTWYYPVGFYRNMEATHSVSERSGLTWLITVTLHMFISTYSQMWVTAFDAPEIGAQIATIFYATAFDYSGVLRYPSGFWKFIYRASPFSYYTSAMLAAVIGDTNIVCSPTELLSFTAPSNSTCGTYMQPYIAANGGYLTDPNSMTNCNFCSQSKTNEFLEASHIDFDKRWQNWGIFFCYIFINMALTVFFYWVARVPKKDRKVHETQQLAAPTTADDDSNGSAESLEDVPETTPVAKKTKKAARGKDDDENQTELESVSPKPRRARKGPRKPRNEV